jgi:hypothetical protein
MPLPLQHTTPLWEFEQGMITRSSGIYAKRRKATEEARALCEAVRKALNEHEAKHGC